MTLKEKQRFVRELVNTVRDAILKQLPNVPEDWDGHELRQLVADRFQESSWTLKEDKPRYRKYKNAVITLWLDRPPR